MARSPAKTRMLNLRLILAINFHLMGPSCEDYREEAITHQSVQNPPLLCVQQIGQIHPR